MKRSLARALSSLALAAVCLLPSAAPAQRGARATLDPAATQALITALAGPEGEYALRAGYAAILDAFGVDLQPYATILEAENRHVAALEQQCVKFGVPIPEDTYWGEITLPATLIEAAEAAVLAESLNAAMYDDLLADVSAYPSLVRVFTNLGDASLNHLSALETALASGGTVPCSAPAGCNGSSPTCAAPARASATAACPLRKSR